MVLACESIFSRTSLDGRQQNLHTFSKVNLKYTKCSFPLGQARCSFHLPHSYNLQILLARGNGASTNVEPWSLCISEFHFNLTDPRSSIDHSSTSSLLHRLLHPVTWIQSPISSLLHPVFYIQSSTSSLLHPVFYIQSSTSSLLHPVFYILQNSSHPILNPALANTGYIQCYTSCLCDQHRIYLVFGYPCT